MRKSYLVMVSVAVAMLALGRPASAQTVDELIARNTEAKGGLAKMRAIQTMRQARRLTLQGMEAPVVVYAKRPNMVRQELQIGGRLVVMAFDGNTPWIVNPNTGTPGAITVMGPQADAMRQDSDFDGPLLDYRTKGTTIDLVGTEALGPKKVFHLKLTARTGLVQHYYLDADTALEVKLVTENESGKVEQELSDYRDVDGVKVPFLIRTMVNGVLQSEMKVDKVEFNLRIDDAMFRMPKGL